MGSSGCLEEPASRNVLSFAFQHSSIRSIFRAGLTEHQALLLSWKQQFFCTHCLPPHPSTPQGMHGTQHDSQRPAPASFSWRAASGGLGHVHPVQRWAGRAGEATGERGQYWINTPAPSALPGVCKWVENKSGECSALSPVSQQDWAELRPPTQYYTLDGSFPFPTPHPTP